MSEPECTIENVIAELKANGERYRANWLAEHPDQTKESMAQALLVERQDRDRSWWENIPPELREKILEYTGEPEELFLNPNSDRIRYCEALDRIKQGVDRVLKENES